VGIRAPRVSEARRRPCRSGSAGLVVLGALILSPAPARASTVTVVQADSCNGDVACDKYAAGHPVPVTVIAGAPGEANRITVTRSGDTWLVRDDGPPLSGCSSCPVTPGEGGIAGLRVNLGDGDDALTLASGLETIVDAGDGADTVAGGPEDDTVDGGLGADHLTGGGGDNLLTVAGRPVPMRIDAGAGMSSEGDTFSGFGTLVGGDRSDVMLGSPGADVLDGGPGNDRLSGLGGSDALLGDIGNDRLSGGAGNDLLIGDPPQGDGYYTPLIKMGHDALDGGPGRDRIRARDGVRDRVDCGPGRDSVRADRRDIVHRCHP
jgi:Ca2+-binding RTX toxin-like protein